MAEAIHKRGISPITAGFVGAAVAASAAGVAAVLSKKENRKKVGKMLTNLKSRGEQLLETAAKRGEDWRQDDEK